MNIIKDGDSRIQIKFMQFVENTEKNTEKKSTKDDERNVKKILILD